MKITRYSQISDEQRKILLNESQPLISSALRSYVGKHPEFFENARLKLERNLAGLDTGPDWLYAFSVYCSSPDIKKPSNYMSAVHAFSNGFCKWLKDSNKAGIAISDINSALVQSYYGHLLSIASASGDKNLGFLSPNTLRRHYSIAKRFIEILKSNKIYGAEMEEEIRFISNPFPNCAEVTKSVELLDDKSFISLYRITRSLCMETMASTVMAAEIINGPKIFPNCALKGRFIYKDFGALLWALKDLNKIPLPVYSKELQKSHRALYYSILHEHGGCGKIYPLFYPTAETIFPFAILLAIYSAANTGPLRALKISNMCDVEVMGVMRTKLSFVKNRGKNYSRSFAHDNSDPLSPNRVIDFLKNWGAPLREIDFQDRLFVFSCREGGQVSVFKTFEDCQTETCAHWNNGMKRFTKLLGLKRMLNMQQIRATVLDIVREISDDDIRAQSAAGGNGESVLQTNYDGSGAKRKRTQQLAGVMATLERHVATKGEIDHRGTSDFSDLGAATPGWNCMNPFDSPIPGEIKGRACHAKGLCPSCGFGFVDVNSSYAFARSLQLHQEIGHAREYVDPKRWIERYSPVIECLAKKWLPSFSSRAIEGAKTLSLNPIGRVE
jgi:hypothetical protein